MYLTSGSIEFITPVIEYLKPLSLHRKMLLVSKYVSKYIKKDIKRI